MTTIKVVKKIWGQELWVCNNNRYCGKILTLKIGYRCSLHCHKKKHETFYILKGKVLMELNGMKKVLLPEMSVTITPFTNHRFTGLKNSTIIEFSTHHKDSDSYRTTKSGKIELKK